MKYVAYLKWILAIFLTAVPVVFAADNPAPAALSYSLPETRYTFQPVVEGTEIVHEFIIQNKGTDTLSILNVKTG